MKFLWRWYFARWLRLNGVSSEAMVPRWERILLLLLLLLQDGGDREQAVSAVQWGRPELAAVMYDVVLWPSDRQCLLRADSTTHKLGNEWNALPSASADSEPVPRAETACQRRKEANKSLACLTGASNLFVRRCGKTGSAGWLSHQQSTFNSESRPFNTSVSPTYYSCCRW